ncbi:MAG: phosphopantothenate/pantothenate synthetase [Spirochaetales bacterium]|nr:phosphopantothenate/pantothenate synthetase [Spirochaetales bacterium]
MSTDIPDSHPRKVSLEMRERLVHGWEQKVVATAGLFAHGRGEAFDYILGEQTHAAADSAIEAAAAALLLADKPVISVNGNVAALTAKECVDAGRAASAQLEINLFYRCLEREKAIEQVLLAAGAKTVYGVGEDADSRVPGLESERGKVDSRGIFHADVVFLALEDGDRTEQLVRMGKKVIAVDLNPFSRTAQFADITIIDNIVRVFPLLIEKIEKLKTKDKTAVWKIVDLYNNKKTVGEVIKAVRLKLADMEKKGIFMEVPKE